MAMAQPKSSELVGSANPRIAPPLPLHHDLDGYRREAKALGIDPMPWQEVAASYATAVDADSPRQILIHDHRPCVQPQPRAGKQR